MNPQILIDAIVRQTTVLIARLSTAGGTRSPLAHVAGEVFVGIVKELEQQGLGKKVIADMFGLALRSYRQKVQRLGESATTRGVTLWTAVHEFVAAHESVTRDALLTEFRYDEEISVRGILNDLVESGLVMRSGRGRETSFRVATDAELLELGGPAEVRRQDVDAALVWLQVYRESPVAQSRLAELVPLSPSALKEAVGTLIRDGRIVQETRDDGVYCLTDHCLIPVGEAAGWEAAVIDHHRAVLNALVAKITNPVSARNDEVGGTTLTFELWAGHPREAEVRSLLASTRERVISLWEDVGDYNRESPDGSEYQVSFYCGQNVVTAEDSE